MSWLGKKAEKVERSNLVAPSLVAALKALDRESIILDSSGYIRYETNKISLLNLAKDNKILSEELLALVRVVRRTGKTQEGSIEVARGPIGEGKRDLQITAALIDNEGSVLVIIDDEGEKQRIDAIRRDFITNISHELKTPIQALSLNSDALLEIKDEPDKVVLFANKIKTQTIRLNDLVKEIINLSKIQDSDPLDMAHNVEISNVIAEAVDQC